MTENSEDGEQPELEQITQPGEEPGRRSRKRQHLRKSREEALTVTAGLTLAAELLSNQLKWVVAAAPGSAQRKRPLARNLARGFNRALRELDVAYRELGEAQAALEGVRGTAQEAAAQAARAAAERRFQEAFSQLGVLPLQEAEG
ncbi:MAG: hypothetical protein K0Q72_2838 [Armatimonadetes bacterium]|nr:hypothetical protein [Armatimonadota bacterium]